MIAGLLSINDIRKSYLKSVSISECAFESETAHAGHALGAMPFE
jgi:hypothetical protein